MIAGDDLVGHLVVEDRARTAEAEPDDVRVLRQARDRRRVGDQLDSLEGAVRRGFCDAHDLVSAGHPERIHDRLASAVDVDEGDEIGDASRPPGECAAALVGRVEGPNPAHERQGADAFRRSELGPDEVGVVGVVLEDTDAGALEGGVPLVLRWADELHQLQSGFAIASPLGEAEHRFAVAQRVELETGNMDLAGPRDDEVAATGGHEPRGIFVRDCDPAEGTVVDRAARRDRQCGDIGACWNTQERLGRCGRGGEKKKSSGKEGWQSVRHWVSKAQVQAGESSPARARSPGR